MILVFISVLREIANIAIYVQFKMRCFSLKGKADLRTVNAMENVKTLC